jgi:predicted transcriptional regulator
VQGRRTQYEIYWEILAYCKTPRPITQIIQRCDLNSKIVQDYVGFLESKGYLSRIAEGERTLYATMPAAREFLNLFMRIYLELYNNSPEFKL